MTLITARLTVAADGTISSSTPLPAGEYAARIETPEAPEPYVPN